MLFACWVWLHCAFSGFPFKSVADRDKWEKVWAQGGQWLVWCPQPVGSCTDEPHDNGVESVPSVVWQRGSYFGRQQFSDSVNVGTCRILNGTCHCVPCQ